MRRGRRARVTQSAADPIPEVRRKWRGTKALNQLFWLLIHHNDLVAPEIINADPDPDMITDYPAAKQAFALLMDGRTLTEVVDLIQDEGLSEVLLKAGAIDSLISADNAINAALQGLDTLELRHIDSQLQGVDQAIATCNKSDDERYFNLLKTRQDLQKRKDAIKNAAPVAPTAEKVRFPNNVNLVRRARIAVKLMLKLPPRSAVLRTNSPRRVEQIAEED